MSSVMELPLETGLIILNFQNKTDSLKYFDRPVHHSFIQFYFCLEGEQVIGFTNESTPIINKANNSMVFYSPLKSTSINFTLTPNGFAFLLLISIKAFHALFSDLVSYIDIFASSDKRYIKQIEINPDIKAIIMDLVRTEKRPRLYLKGKVYELLGLYFNGYENPNIEHCPFLADKNNTLKIKKAKEIITNNLNESPTLSQLAAEVGMSLKRLTLGFKQVYGQTVYSFLLDYKMEFSKKILEDNNHSVNEVAFKVGYSHPSHFIETFKKKYGITPKQFTLEIKSSK